MSFVQPNQIRHRIKRGLYAAPTRAFRVGDAGEQVGKLRGGFVAYGANVHIAQDAAFVQLGDKCKPQGMVVIALWVAFALALTFLWRRT